MSASSVFGADKNSFIFRNIQKTAADFEAVRETVAEFGSNRAVEKWLDFKEADLFYLLSIILFVLAFLEEKRMRLHSLIRSTAKGRSALVGIRIGILASAAALYTVFLYGLPLLFSFGLYGGINDTGRSIQSLVSFKTCCLPLTISTWIVVYLLVKIICGFFLGTVFWFMLSFLNQIQLAWFVIIGILAGEYVLNTMIAPQMTLAPLRYVNLFSFISPLKLLQSYQNINVFSFPVNSLTFMAWLLPVLSVSLCCGLIVLQIRRFPLGNRDILTRPLRFVNRVADAVRVRYSLLLFEGYKILILGGSLLFLAAGIAIGFTLKYKSSEIIDNL